MGDAKQIQADARTAALFGRLALAELARWSLERADVRDLVLRQRSARRALRRRRALNLGALVLGVVVAGVVVKRGRPDGAPPEDLPAPAA